MSESDKLPESASASERLENESDVEAAPISEPQSEPIAPGSKLITFAIPCYNSAGYMDHCIQSILDGSSAYLDDIEILIVDDGSTKDDTGAKADEWQKRYPGVIWAIHQSNAGHGGAVNRGLDCASGIYFRVVDSDDWLDRESLEVSLDLLAVFAERDKPVDMVISNYVYENVARGEEVMDYKGILPEGKEFGWDEVGKFPISRYILMHSVAYRTQLLRDCGLRLPEKTFYVDNIFVYSPLPYVKTMFYLDIDLYRYFIGRDDQSVNEKVMVGRVDQQLRITRIMIDSHDLSLISNRRLQDYMTRHLLMMMTICTVFLMLSDRPGRLEQRDEIWKYLAEHNPRIFPKLRRKFFGRGCNLRGEPGRYIVVLLYRIAQKIWKFN